MEVDFNGEVFEKTPIAVRLYVDSSGPCDNELGERWLYIGLLAIPEDRYGDTVRWLAEDRISAGYDREVHFVDLRNYSYAYCYNEKTLLAKRWVERVIWDDQKVFHFHLLGLNLTNLQHQAFGTGSEQDRNIYNRFFRTAMAYALKYFFGSVVVIRVFHDRSSLVVSQSEIDG